MRKAILIVVSGMLMAFQVMSCGSSNNGGLDISPEGPTIVKRGATLQFTSNQVVTWSVAGGNANGTISADGLYTAPDTLPLSHDQVSVLAEDGDGNSAEAFVDLRAADTLAFAAPVPINSQPIEALAILINITLGPVNDYIAAARLSVEADSVWGSVDSSVAPVTFFSQNPGLGGFAPQIPATSAGERTFPIALELDDQDNPIVMAVTEPTPTPSPTRLSVLTSTDGGASFSNPSPVSTANPAFEQQGGSFRRDAQGDLHLVFRETDTSVLNGPTNVSYTRSDDGGVNWTPALPLSNLPDDTVDVLFPFVAASENGQNVVACWNQDEQIFYAFSSDGGVSFSASQPLTTADENQICRIAVGPDGQFYVTYSTVSSPTEVNISLRTSTDGGATFGSPVFVNGTTPEQTEAIAWIAVDDLGRIDVVWISDPTGGDIGDIVHARSLDGGATFSPKVTLVDSTATNTIALPNGLRHDRSGRLYLQYFDVFGSMTTTLDLSFLYGE